MVIPERDVQVVRKKRTILLLAGGAASLILPLVGIIYIRMSEAKTARPPDSSVMFDRRENGETKVSVSQTVTIVNPSASAGPGASSLPVAGGPTMTPAPGGSSLDFVKGGANNAYFQDKQAAAPAASTQAAPVAPAAAPEPAPAPKTVAKKGGKKAFNMPKLQGTKSFSSFKGASPKPTGGQGMTGVADPQAGKGGGDMADMLKNVPGGANNPEVQKYLKSQGK
ncbi:MAG: hypothetical protein PHS14_20065 [Elusimicrobia bacterium]|nr:hypothetical protein [Elusimicrobiota bacterium]